MISPAPLQLPLIALQPRLQYQKRQFEITSIISDAQVDGAIRSDPSPSTYRWKMIIVKTNGISFHQGETQGSESIDSSDSERHSGSLPLPGLAFGASPKSRVYTTHRFD
jgi:hypothetical protein